MNEIRAEIIVKELGAVRSRLDKNPIPESIDQDIHAMNEYTLVEEIVSQADRIESDQEMAEWKKSVADFIANDTPWN